MKNSIKALVVMAIIAIAGVSFAQNSASATATANASVICPIKLTPMKALAFGNVVSGTGTETVGETNNPSYTGNVNPGSQGGTITSASWCVMGGESLLFNISDDGVRAFTLTDGAGNNPISGNAAAPSAEGTNPNALSAGAGNGGCDGKFTFYQGGKITISGQPSGSYSTTNANGSGWSETVTYN